MLSYLAHGTKRVSLATIIKVLTIPAGVASRIVQN